ncbi:MAG: flagellar basal body rod protein FlgB [Rugosibacter sp.]|nr:flagellar basal body rod protein FlgB [Rugosibacter sp.]
MIDRFDAQLQIQRAALGALTYRQELLASNIANADTPNFKARDIDFKGALEAAVAGRTGGGVASVTLAATSPRHIGGALSAGGAFAGAVKYRTEFQPNVDGNTVNMDIERSAFAENALRVEAAMSFITGDIKSLQLAMSP